MSTEGYTGNRTAEPGEVCNDVLIGKDRWLYLWQGSHFQFDHLTGKKTPHPKAVSTFVGNLRSRMDLCSKAGVLYAHVIFPSKPVMMPEHLPVNLQGEVGSLYERSYQGACTTEVASHIIYPRKVLNLSKSKGSIFFRDDTHMTSFGYLSVMRETFGRLGLPHRFEDYLVTEAIRHRGDLSKMLTRSEAIDAEIFRPHLRSETVLDNLAFLPGNSGNIVVAHNPSSASPKRLLLFGDSFLKGCILLLSSFFRDILYVRSDVFHPDLIYLFSPSVVISSSAERYMASIRPDTAAESIILRTYGSEHYHPPKEFVSALRAQLAKGPYPQQYRSWAESFRTDTSILMGTEVCYDQISCLEGQPGWMRSTGDDPKIVYRNISEPGHSRLRVEIDMVSTVASTAQLFAGKGPDPQYTKELSWQARVVPGENKLRFDIVLPEPASALRFDPLARPGCFMVTCAIVKTGATARSQNLAAG